MVADGLGGQEAGEHAARLAASTVRARYYASQAESDLEALQEAIEAANTTVYEAGRSQPDKAGMACSLTALAIHENNVVIGHLGNSRAYLIRNDSIARLTTDHTWAASQVEKGLMTPEEALAHPHRNIIARAIGQRAVCEVEMLQERLRPGDTWILCTDGVTSVLTDEEIGDSALDLKPREAASSIIAAARKRGAQDNLTVAVLQAAGGTSAGLAGALRGWWPVAAALVVLMVVAAFATVSTALSSPGPRGYTPVAVATRTSTAIAGSEDSQSVIKPSNPVLGLPTPAPTNTMLPEPSPTIPPTPIPTAPPTAQPTAPPTAAVPTRQPSPAASPTLPTGGQVVQVTDRQGATLRRQATASSERMALLTWGQQLRFIREVTGTEPSPGMGRLWYEVETTNGSQRGFVHSSFLSKPGPASPSATPSLATPTPTQRTINPTPGR